MQKKYPKTQRAVSLCGNFLCSWRSQKNTDSCFQVKRCDTSRLLQLFGELHRFLSWLSCMGDVKSVNFISFQLKCNHLTLDTSSFSTFDIYRKHMSSRAMYTREELMKIQIVRDTFIVSASKLIHTFTTIKEVKKYVKRKF